MRRADIQILQFFPQCVSIDAEKPRCLDLIALDGIHRHLDQGTFYSGLDAVIEAIRRELSPKACEIVSQMLLNRQ